MLEPIRHLLKSKRIILASASPRRKEILEKNLGLNVEIVNSMFEENLDKNQFATPADYVVENSRQKSMAVAKRLKDGDWLLVIGADTVVTHGNKIYEKPTDKPNAYEILTELSGTTHQVVTGVTLIKNTPGRLETRSFFEVTQVCMSDLDDQTKNAYINTNEPLDKAGAYGIQGLGSSLIKSITGDYYNVVGFPVYKFATELLEFL